MKRRRGEASERLSVKENFHSFCLQTSLHGWQYMVDKPKSALKRAFWTAIVVLAMFTAGTFLYSNTWVSECEEQQQQ